MLDNSPERFKFIKIKFQLIIKLIFHVQCGPIWSFTKANTFTETKIIYLVWVRTYILQHVLMCLLAFARGFARIEYVLTSLLLYFFIHFKTLLTILLYASMD